MVPRWAGLLLGRQLVHVHLYGRFAMHLRSPYECVDVVGAVPCCAVADIRAKYPDRWRQALRCGLGVEGVGDGWLYQCALEDRPEV